MLLHAFVCFIYKRLGMPIPEVNEESKYDFIVDEHWAVSIYVQQKHFVIQAKVGKPLSPAHEEENRNLFMNLLDFKLKTMRVMDEVVCLDKDTQQLYCRKFLDPETLNEKNAWEVFDDFLVNIEIIEERFFEEKPTQERMNPDFLL